MLDCKQSLFFFQFSKGSASRARERRIRETREAHFARRTIKRKKETARSLLQCMLSAHVVVILFKTVARVLCVCLAS